MRRIPDIDTANGNDVVILGAYGCGAFKNPPEVAAVAMKQMAKEYGIKQAFLLGDYSNERADGHSPMELLLNCSLKGFYVGTL